MAKVVLGQESEKKFRQTSFSNNTVQRWISDLRDDIKQQVISDTKNAQFGLFSVQLHESLDVSVCFQLMVLCRYLTNTNINEDYVVLHKGQIGRQSTSWKRYQSFLNARNSNGKISAMSVLPVHLQC